MQGSTSVPSAVALAPCLHRMTRFSCTTVTEVATTTTIKVEMGDDGHDDDVLHNIKELRVVQIELCRRQIVQRDVGHWVNHWLHFHL